MEVCSPPDELYSLYPFDNLPSGALVILLSHFLSLPLESSGHLILWVQGTIYTAASSPLCCILGPAPPTTLALPWTSPQTANAVTDSLDQPPPLSSSSSCSFRHAIFPRQTGQKKRSNPHRVSPSGRCLGSHVQVDGVGAYELEQRCVDTNTNTNPSTSSHGDFQYLHIWPRLSPRVREEIYLGSAVRDSKGYLQACESRSTRSTRLI